MHTFLLVVQALLALAIVGLVLIQRSDSDGFGLSGGGGNFLSGRAKANLLTRATAIIAGLFFINSLVLTMVVHHGGGSSIADQLRQEAPADAAAPAVAPANDNKAAADTKPVEAPAATDTGKAPVEPAKPAEKGAAPASSVPLAE